MSNDWIKDLITVVPDFPKKGVNFLDISPLLASPEAMDSVIKDMCEVGNVDSSTKIGGFDARGFLFGTPMSIVSNTPFFPIRKAGKLPGPVVQKKYGLEYGESKIAIQRSAINPGDKVLLLDDVLATGGTMKAGCDLVEMLGGNVIGCLTLIELTFLPGREVLDGYDVKSLVKYN